MTITKTWEVNTCVRATADGYVSKVIYRVDATDGTYSTRATGEVDLERPETLIPYKDLTHDQVIGWVKAKIEQIATSENGLTIAQIEAALDAQVTEQKTPTMATGVPWS
tara:strand:+ start:61 stop:387 length:327 start_codon:yes stop_codon:yes gene_type:complete